MTVLLVAATLIAGTGAIAALAPLDVRLGVIGLTAALVAAALIADPLPEPAVLAVRLSAALLVVVLLRAAGADLEARGDARAAADDRAPRGWSGRIAGSEIGWPAAVLLGVGGAVAGLAIGLNTLKDGWAIASLALAGLLAAAALAPILAEVAGLRRTMAAVLVAEAAILVRNALAGSSSVLEEIVFAALLVVVAAASVALAVADAGGAVPTSVAARAGGATPLRSGRSASRRQ